MEKILFGIHLPVMGFDNTNHEKKGIDESPNTREQMLSIIKKAEFLGYDSLSVNDHIVFRTSWLDSLSVLSAAAAVTNKIKLYFNTEYSCKNSCNLCQCFISHRLTIIRTLICSRSRTWFT